MVADSSAASLKVETHEVSGISFAVHTLGSGKPLFLVPAFHTDILRILPLVTSLATYFRVIIPVLPGISTQSPLGHYKHTIAHYGILLAKLIDTLRLSDYILSGICLGGPIGVEILKDVREKPRHILFFEPIIDGSFIHLSPLPRLVERSLLALGPHHYLVKVLVGNLLHNKTFLQFYFRLTYFSLPNREAIVQHQLHLTDEMNSRAWAELIEDIFRLRFQADAPQYDIPATLIFNDKDNILDTDSTIKCFQYIFPKSTILRETLFDSHAPPGPMSQSEVDRLLRPHIPLFQSLARA